ncbi:hypothetical protein MWMV17_MWMV17_03534 [Acinetobacter calcoaceticus]|uniref:Uncharacterized protein n=1 Tax=Acinetobacter calcoaceticus DSM 30006 = CIP 81.8 TaxID=981331 RepID=A0ABN0KB54_ACICA|nr:hypothetical protein [Acinetobacter calcoaceticus]ENW01453.1 hypothetical protein F936_00865 [Acinetobacter calcoaceticus DSM 30006 = CIP 81.8]CAI3121806.1 hypothetical protein MWMV17_MWMV17_03534 [Acinetobacter calcoaceticus]SUU64477.1 Uncharacterised protein [Acinetobacter calcoaceticus]
MKQKSYIAGIIMFLLASSSYAAPIITSGFLSPTTSGCFAGNVVYVLNLDNIPYRVVYEISYVNAKNQTVKWTQQIDIVGNEKALLGCGSIQDYPYRFNAGYKIVSYTKL